jgi:hypothetical protein
MNLTPSQRDELLKTIEIRFERNSNRHPGINWSYVETRLNAATEKKLWSLAEMERTGGEPDVVGINERNDEAIFHDCAAESPTGRRSLCYDQAALESRKENRPQGSVLEMAADMGIELLTEEQYRYLQVLGDFDTKTSSWIHTPEAVRKLGGSLFGDRRYNHVFIYHNGASSYYAARGFRGWLSV